MSGQTQGKIWGKTKCLLNHPFLEMHRIEIDRGGCCSKHKHNHKTNFFYVESGILVIRVWQDDYALTDETILNAGEYMEVKPGVYHQFEAMTGVIAFEVYYPTPIGDDIVRETHGYNKHAPKLAGNEPSIGFNSKLKDEDAEQ